MALAAVLALVWRVPDAVSKCSEEPAIQALCWFYDRRAEGAMFSGGPNQGNAYRPAQAVSPDRALHGVSCSRQGQNSLLWVRRWTLSRPDRWRGPTVQTIRSGHPTAASLHFSPEASSRKSTSRARSLAFCESPPARAAHGTRRRNSVRSFSDESVDASCGPTAAHRFQPRGWIRRPRTFRTSFRGYLPDGRRFIFFAQPANEVRLGSLDSTDSTTC